MRILLIVYDNQQHIMYFPMGIAYLAGALKAQGHDVTIYNQAITHRPDTHITAYIDLMSFDAVGLGFVGNYYTFNKAMSISRAVNKCRNRKNFKYILGGHGPSADPEFFMKKMGADAVVEGEGEKAVLQALSSGKKGVFTAPLIKDLDTIPWPAYDLFPIEIYRLRREPNCRPTDFVLPIISARGCTHKCNFCYRMDKGYRMRTVRHVMEEIDLLVRVYRINYFDFADELTMPNEDRIVELCKALAPLKVRWMCNGRLDVAAKYPHLLKTMRKAGCVFINYGIESMDDAVLERMNKKLTVKQIQAGVKATLAAGISPGLNIIFGHIGDTKEILERGVNFIVTHDDGAQRRTMLPVTPYPGSELFKEAIRRGLLKDTGDFYKKHTNSDLPTVNFTTLSDTEFREALYAANIELLTNHYNKQLDRACMDAHDVYIKKDTSFRGFRI